MQFYQSVEALSPALKLRFTFARSAIENQLLDETRFSPCLLGDQIPVAPSQVETDIAPLALKWT